MTDLAIIVEGQTEEAFVKRVLSPALWGHGVSAWAILPGRGANRRGGRWPWVSIRRDVENLLKARSDRYCAILFDYYGLPPDWPGRIAASEQPIESRARAVEQSLAADLSRDVGDTINHARFLPHIQLHEFEAKLFSECRVLASTLGLPARSLEEIVEKCGTPEFIDDGAETAPSKRLESLCRLTSGHGYQKIASGVTAAERIGVKTMREKCPHFDRWLGQIELLGKA